MGIEKAMQFILEHQAQAEVQMARMREAQERMRQAQEQSSARHDKEMAEIRQVLRRAIRLGVQEARNERKRRQEMDARLSAAQLLTEEKLQRLEAEIDSFLKGLRGGNGSH